MWILVQPASILWNSYQSGGSKIHNEPQAADIEDAVYLPLKEKVVPYRCLGFFINLKVKED
jgi:hypothetical protein